MPVFGLTVIARDAVGSHYVNHTVRAADLERADALILSYYDRSDDEFVSFDQAVQLEADGAGADLEGIMETMGKIYFDE